jgi:hypothetical protein
MWYGMVWYGMDTIVDSITRTIQHNIGEVRVRRFYFLIVFVSSFIIMVSIFFKILSTLLSSVTSFT